MHARHSPISGSPLARAALLFSVLASGACQDSPTATPELPTPLPALSAGDASPGRTAFYCSTRTRGIASGSLWETSRLTLYFPRGELDRAGRTVLYQLRRPDDSGFVRYAADCTVPYTEGALRRVDRAFGVTGGAEQFAARRDMVTTQGCVSAETACPLEPIVVKAPLKPNSDPDDPCTRYPDQCEDGGGGTADGDGAGGTGWPADEGGDLPPEPGDDSVEEETPPDCANPLSEKQVAYCSGYVPTGALLTRIQEALTAFKTRGAACADLAAKGEALLQAGTFKVTDNTYRGWAAAAARPGDWVIFTRSVLDYPNSKYVDAMIAHELDHSQDNTFPGVWTDADGHALNPSPFCRAG